jgi:hypothetical protein
MHIQAVIGFAYNRFFYFMLVALLWPVSSCPLDIFLLVVTFFVDFSCLSLDRKPLFNDLLFILRPPLDANIFFRQVLVFSLHTLTFDH